MQSTRSSSSTILFILVLVLTAPIWLTAAGVLIGVFGGIIGGIFGIIFGIFGALIGGFFALLALPFKIIFGHGDWFDGGFDLSGKGIFFIIIVILLVSAMKRK